MVDVALAPFPQRVGNYELLREIGRGGMGEVYEARHWLYREQRYAVKLIQPSFTGAVESVQRLLREGQAARAAAHDGIVRVVDAGIEPDRTVYLVMELLVGESLRARLGSPEATAGGVLAILCDCLSALAAAHAAGVIHRDLKPENLFVETTARGERAKILDFGLARVLGSQTMTRPGSVMGTLAYMSPDQLQDAHGVTSAADVWSVGVIAYEALTGRLPFRGTTIQQMALQLLNAAPDPVSVTRPTVDPALTSLVERCLLKDPRARPSHGGELLAELAPLLARDTVQRSIAYPIHGGPTPGATGAARPSPRWNEHGPNGSATSERGASSLDGTTTRVRGGAEPIPGVTSLRRVLLLLALALIVLALTAGTAAWLAGK